MHECLKCEHSKNLGQCRRRSTPRIPFFLTLITACVNIGKTLHRRGWGYSPAPFRRYLPTFCHRSTNTNKSSKAY